MFKTQQEISEWFENNINSFDYVMIDAPWNYINCNYSSFWDNISYMDIFQSCATNFMFIWTTTEGLATLMAHQTESEYELRALIPWLCTSNPVDCSTPTKICKEYLAVFCKPCISFLRTCTATMIVEDDNTHKPRRWEESFIQMLTNKGLVGRYLSPKGFITFETKPKPKIQKTDLF